MVNTSRSQIQDSIEEAFRKTENTSSLLIELFPVQIEPKILEKH